MRFDWKDYIPDTMPFVENWLDEHAVRMAGMDDGFRAFHEYWINDGEMTLGKDYWCKVVYKGKTPFAVIALSLYEGNFNIMEFLVMPEMRGKGLGTALLRELLSDGEMIIGHQIERATAVIFPNNIASQKAFEKAGFVFDHLHEDGDAWYYRYEKECGIKSVGMLDISVCVAVIKESFRTVADEFGFTEENAPRFTAFAMNEDRLLYHYNVEKRPMYKCVENGRIIGYYSLLINHAECELNNLCVLPDFRHRGLGKELLEDAFKKAKKAGCAVMKIGIVEENTVLKKWYESFGFKHMGSEKYDFFPFTCGYMIREI